MPASGRFGLAARIAALAIGAVLLTSLALAWIGYVAETRAAMNGIDNQLRSVARTLGNLLPRDLLQHAQIGKLTPAQYEPIVRRLSQIASDANVFYVYTVIERNGEILIPVSSASQKELTERNWPPAMDKYDQPPPELKQTLSDGVPRFASYTDEFGSFRSIFAPIGVDGARVIVGVDVQLNDLRAIARKNLIHFALVGLLISLIVGAIAGYVGHHLSAPIATLREDVKAFADDDFSNDDASVASLIEIGNKNRTEIGSLALSFLDMRKRLMTHIDRLTKVTAGKQEILSRLDVARRIQRGLLPETAPSTPNFEIYGWSEAAEETGGDFYDWIDRPDGRIMISVADVTGHGIGPAIMAAVCRAYARATLQGGGALAPQLEQLNRLVHNDTKGEQFVTYFVGLINPTARRITIMSAGHGPILVCRANSDEVVETATHSVPLGVIQELKTDPNTEITMQPGDVLMVTSDGFFEWHSTAGEQFGTQRLEASLKRNATLSAEQIVDHLREEVRQFTIGTQQPDDMTAVIVKCRG